MDRDQGCAGQHRLDRAAAILGDGRTVVVRAEADVEAGEYARRDAAFPTEEAVGDAIERAGVARWVGHATSLANIPPSRLREGLRRAVKTRPAPANVSVTAITLNNSPISSGLVSRR